MQLIKEVEKTKGKLSRDQRQKLHHAITKQGIDDFWEIVDEGLTMFGQACG